MSDRESGDEKDELRRHLDGTKSIEETSSADDTPSHLQPIDTVKFGIPDGPDNILYAEDGSIRGATLPKLIEKLSESTTDVKMIFDFLLTYRTYASPEYILALLRKRYAHFFF